jgi:hypothetical protein
VYFLRFFRQLVDLIEWWLFVFNYSPFNWNLTPCFEVHKNKWQITSKHYISKSRWRFLYFNNTVDFWASFSLFKNVLLLKNCYKHQKISLLEQKTTEKKIFICASNSRMITLFGCERRKNVMMKKLSLCRQSTNRSSSVFTCCRVLNFLFISRYRHLLFLKML